MTCRGKIEEKNLKPFTCTDERFCEDEDLQEPQRHFPFVSELHPATASGKEANLEAEHEKCHQHEPDSSTVTFGAMSVFPKLLLTRFLPQEVFQFFSALVPKLFKDNCSKICVSRTIYTTSICVRIIVLSAHVHLFPTACFAQKNNAVCVSLSWSLLMKYLFLA